MSTSFPTAAPNSPSEQLNCPEWCVYDDHDDFPDNPLHKGPAIGRVRIWGYADEPASATVDDDQAGNCDFSAAQLRELAAEALAAAAWIEAHQ